MTLNTNLVQGTSLIDTSAVLTKEFIENNLIGTTGKIISKTAKKLGLAGKGDLIYRIMNGIDQIPVCSHCNNLPAKFNTFTTGYSPYCGLQCATKSIARTEKRESTLNARYGVSNTSLIPEVIEAKKAKQLAKNASAKTQTVLEKWGVAHPMQSQILKDRTKQTNIERYGTEYPMQSNEVKAKSRQTFFDRYGVDHAMKTQQVKDTRIKNNLEKYGVESTYSVPEFREKAKATNIARYGVEYPSQASSIKDKTINTNLERYGANHYHQSEEGKMIKKQTCISKYGVPNASQAHISIESHSKLCNTTWLEENKKVDSDVLAEQLGVCSTTLLSYFKRANIDKPRPLRSKYERQIHEFLNSHGIETVCNSRALIPPKEIDIYIPALKLGIEVDGLYWHSEASGKGKWAHRDKQLLAEQAGIKLIHITDAEWITKREIVEARLLAKIGKSTKVYARKCTVVEVSAKESTDFLLRHHIQGPAAASICLGLKVNGSLVAHMTFSKPRFSTKYQYELVRYASVGNVVGGASKLFKTFVKQYMPSSVVSYSDLRWNTGAVYEKIGMKFVHNSAPNYWYHRNDNVLESRIKYQKHKLHTAIASFDPILSEWQNMQSNGYDRYWDCGNAVFSWHSIA